MRLLILLLLLGTGVTFLRHNPNQVHRGLLFNARCPETRASQSLSTLRLAWNFPSPLPRSERLVGAFDSPKSVPFAAAGVLGV